MTRVVIDLREAKKRLRGKEIRPAPIVAQLALAEEMSAALERGEVNRTGLAHLYGLTKPRVTQLLNLLKLHPLILDYLRSLGSGRPRAWITERRLRGLTGIEPAAQVDAAVKVVPGFAGRLSLATTTECSQPTSSGDHDAPRGHLSRRHDLSSIRGLSGTGVPTWQVTRMTRVAPGDGAPS